MDDGDDAFAAFERSMSRVRSVVEVEHERTAKGYPTDEALLEHGAELEDDITRTLAKEAEELRAGNPPAVILEFAPTEKPGET